MVCNEADQYRWVDAGGIVSASMEKNDRLFRDLLNVTQTARLVQATRLGIVVSVLLDLEAGEFEDRDVVAPSRSWLVDLLASGEPFALKIERIMEVQVGVYSREVEDFEMLEKNFDKGWLVDS